MRLTHLSYEDWLERAFGREVRIQQAAWSFDHDRDWWDSEPAIAVTACHSNRVQAIPAIEDARRILGEYI